MRSVRQTKTDYAGTDGGKVSFGLRVKQ